MLSYNWTIYGTFARKLRLTLFRYVLPFNLIKDESKL